MRFPSGMEAAFAFNSGGLVTFTVGKLYLPPLATKTANSIPEGNLNKKASISLAFHFTFLQMLTAA